MLLLFLFCLSLQLIPKNVVPNEELTKFNFNIDDRKSPKKLEIFIICENVSIGE
ncbi:protein of unknown function [Methanocaldococcus lauensis]|nr:protein of unknown function [Methanocaldococcus lauensis]